MDLEGRSAIVAGGAGGLGSATVRRLVASGAGAVVLDPDSERAEVLVADLGDRVAVVGGDSNDDDAVGRAIDLARTLGTFSVAVSATGVVIRSQPLVSRDGTVLPKATLEANLGLHVLGPFNLARLSAAAFADNEPNETGERGVIVQTASISAFDGQVTMVPYAAAKGAIAQTRTPRGARSRAIGSVMATIAPLAAA